MAKQTSPVKRSAAAKRTGKVRAAATAKRQRTETSAAKRKAPRREGVSAAAIAKAKKLEKVDAALPPLTLRTEASSGSARVAGFPQTYIQEVNVSLDDPNHSMTLTWTGPNAADQETGPFHTSPGAGLRGLNCDNVVTSRRSGSLCTPKGTFPVEGFASRLNSDARATYVTFFVRRRGIGLHYFPTVPRVAASHGCIRVQEKRIARLIHDNARVGLTNVVVDGTWNKPPKQW